MKAILRTKIFNFWESLISISVNRSSEFTEQRRIKIIDTISFLCLPVILLFSILAFSVGHYYLTIFYIPLAFLLIVLIYGNYKMQGESFRITLIFFITISCAVGSILFNNGQGYYIMLICFLSVLFYGLRKSILYLNLFCAALYLATEIIKLFFDPIEPVGTFIKVIKLANVVITLSVLVYFLYDIKKAFLKTLEETKNKKKELEDYNTLLINQAVSLELKNKDITELKNKNEELSSIVYHQLRSPVVTFADILSRYIEYSEFSKESFIEISKITQKKVNETLDVIDRILKWNQKGIDGIQPHVTKCDPITSIKNAIVQCKVQMENKGITITCPVESNYFINADVNHVLIILLNILTNAIKFSPPGGTIEINIFKFPNKCRLLICNSGKGIERRHLQSIFSPLQIVSVNGTMNERGTGLGLKICKNLIEKNNGTIEIESEENGITTVIIELPAN
mgnify:CR=1 FL=1